MKNTITYSKHGDYELPDLLPPESPNIGKYGELHRKYLREQQDGIYMGLLILGKLNARLEQIDREANEMMNKLTKRLKSLEGITEKLKSEDQLAWVQAMNSIRNRAEEIVLHELIYR